MGFNRFRGRNRRSGQYSRKTGKRRYAGAKKLKRLRRRARRRRSADAQSHQIRQIAGSLATTKGTRFVHSPFTRPRARARPSRAELVKFHDTPPSFVNDTPSPFTSAMNTVAVGLGSVPMQYAIGKFLQHQTNNWRVPSGSHTLRSGRSYTTYL